MAILFGEDLFRCACGHSRFEEIEVKSFNKEDEKTLKVYEPVKYIKCTDCSTLYQCGGIDGFKIVK